MDDNFAVAMDYTAALEEESHAQDECILDLEASMNGQTVLTKATKYVASEVTAGGNNKYLKELRAIMKQLKALVTAQAEILADQSVKTHSGGGSGGKKTPK